jgi:hypothetical protein
VTHYGEGSFIEGRTKLRADGTALFYKETSKSIVGIIIALNHILLTLSRWISFYISQRRDSVSSDDYRRYIRKDLSWHIQLLRELL